MAKYRKSNEINSFSHNDGKNSSGSVCRGKHVAQLVIEFKYGVNGEGDKGKADKKGKEGEGEAEYFKAHCENLHERVYDCL